MLPDLGRHTDDKAPGRYVLQYDRIRTNHRPLSNDDVAEHLGPGMDHNAGFDLRCTEVWVAAAENNMGTDEAAIAYGTSSVNHHCQRVMSKMNAFTYLDGGRNRGTIDETDNDLEKPR